MNYFPKLSLAILEGNIYIFNCIVYSNNRDN